MIDEPDLSRLARTIGDPTRIRMLSLLMEGRALTAKELAYGADIEPATATAHLQRLQGEQLVHVTSQGRHKYFRIESPAVAKLVESLMVLAPERKAAAPSKPLQAMRLARFCYDHLAGQLGVRLTQSLVARGLISLHEDEFIVSAEGEAWFRSFGLDLAQLRRNRRQFAPPCMDWSERQDHMAGSLGAAIASRMMELGWLERSKHTRAVSITAAGQRGLAEYFDLQLG
ncbi:helix-turn-helix transcriptional regulator [Undibacterium sp.]|jgi:DNA-binding transcriptional ArsR family regulator|uniref:ArsR/SmtB family transcription factor n=1 Tax=Undibacterium sp. TaxID=1914977 RepID=UPI002BDF5233|nr:helix-turn-helix transcriptional regulator [Undibacterium sp.]HTD05334.1 helix-turn-helix transcriptional regulator [Undibacterium sp.]